MFLVVALSAFSTYINATQTSAATKPVASRSGTLLERAQALVEENCSVCHSTDQIKTAQKTPTEWKLTVERMVTDQGAQLSGEDRYLIIQYLSDQVGTVTAAPGAH